MRATRLTRLISTCALVALLPLACGDDSGGDDGASESTTTGMTTSTSGMDTSSEATTDDTSNLPGECNPWEQDCPDPADKCMPWSDSIPVPSEYRCCPGVENPKLVGETCEITGYDGSCMDNCDKGMLCVLDDPDNLEGVCRPYCNPSNPECEFDETCKSFFEMLMIGPPVPLCMDQCDPLLQDCDRPGWLCLPDAPTESGQSGFICYPPSQDAPKALFDSCGFLNDCDEGLVCVPGDRLPNCGFTCCTAFCDLSDTDPCPALDPSLQCVDWMAPDPQWQDVGVCALPA